MRKPVKIAAIVAAVFVVLLLAAIVAAKLLISPEGVRRTVLPLVEKKLHRPVKVGKIDIGLFSGIILEDMSVSEKDGSGEFIRAKGIKLKYQFWPLLSKRIVVDEVRLDGPQVKVIRLPDGTFNYSDILVKKEVPPEEKVEEKDKGKVNLVVSKVILSGGAIQYEDRKTPAPFTYTVSGIEFQSTGIALDKPVPFTARASVPGASVSAEGKVADITGKPSIDAVIRLMETNLEKLAAGLPPAFTAKAKAFAPSGTVTGRFTLAGPTSAPKQLLRDGELRLDQVQVTLSGQRASLAGDIAVKPDSASSSNLQVALGPNKAQVAFSASNLLAKPLSLTANVKSDRFDLDPFLKKEGKGAPATTPAAAKPEPGPLNIPVTASGTVQVGQTTYKGLPLTQLLLKYRLKNNVLHVDQLSGNVAGGSFSDTARVDLGRKGFDYSSQLKVQGVQADPVVTAFAPKAAGAVSGTMTLNADINGKGTQGDAMKRNLSGRGDFAISEGKLTGTGMIQGLARFLGTEQLRVVQFSKFAGTFRIESGKVFLDSGVAGRDVQMTPRGTAGIVDKSLDLSLMTRLSPAITARMARGDVARFVTDDQGWGNIPLKVTGTFSSPKFRLDSSLVKSKAREKLQQTIEEKLFPKKEGEPQRPEKELLQRGLKGIFGK